MTSRDARPTILVVAGARPNFMKVAPIVRELRSRGAFDVRLLHTGQHYDVAMNDVFFAELDIPAPDVHLGVGSGSHAVQTAAVMQAIDPVLDTIAPDLLIVVGDVNSTLAAALVAVKKGMPVAHVEAGLRSFDRTMPEEINRVLTDQISELLFTSEEDALANLTREGIAADKVRFVGNVMIDSLHYALGRAVPAEHTFAEVRASPAFRRQAAEGYALLTMHRPSNVDDAAVLARLLTVLRGVADRIALVFAMHPRTAKMIREHGLEATLDHPAILTTPPLSYLSTVGLMRSARLVLTDSGGIQEETTGLGIPCLTLRPNTERPATVTAGTNRIVGNDSKAILAAVDEILTTGGKAGRIPPLWDGRAALRIADELGEYFA